jgi:Fe-S-cluster containining protein
MGECKRCGLCCKEIVIPIYVKSYTAVEKADLVEYLNLRNGIKAEINGYKLLLSIKADCTKLIAAVNEPAFCIIQENKPKICKRFPLTTAKELIPYCEYFKED